VGRRSETDRNAKPFASASATSDATPDDAANRLHDRDGLEGALARRATHAHYEDAHLAKRIRAPRYPNP
jgi:hypothetical protein